MKKTISLLLVFLMVLGTVGCTQNTDTPDNSPEATESPAPSLEGTVADGTFTAVSRGMSDGLKVEVTFAGGKISDVKIVEHSETAYISDPAIEQMPAKIVAGNSVNVDAIAGATLTSNGIIEGVKQAILDAGGKVEDFLAETAAAEQQAVTMDVDLVIAGGGLSGLTAAIMAAEKGANVLLLEKTAQTGGSLALAAGNFISVNSELAKEYGVEDNKEDAMTLWHKTADYGPDAPTLYPNYDRVDFMLDQVGDILDWMKAHGVPYYKASEANSNNMVKIYSDGQGAAVATALDQAARDAGVQILENTAATELIVENGAVVGLLAESETQKLTVNAKNVFLATGGFGKNPDMVNELTPDFVDAVTDGGAGNTGDGFRMAEAVGAVVYEDPWVIGAGIIVDPALSNAVESTSALAYKDKVLVDSTGKRFISEDTGIPTVINNAVAIRESAVYAIFDSGNDEANLVLEAGVAAGAVFKGETVEALAASAGIDAAALAQTINAYNRYATAGADAEFGKNADNITAYGDGPFYAVVYKPRQIGTISGVVTDYEGHVLDANGNSIIGLYAIGEMSNREYYNQAYVGAASLSLYSIAAKLAVESAIK